MDITVIMELVESMVSNPLILLIVAVWLTGRILKELPVFNDNLIPLTLTIVGMILGYVLFDQSLTGVIVGGLCSQVTKGLYDDTNSIGKLFKDYM